MKTPLNLGVLDDTVLIFGGPYSNYHALHALKGVAEELNISPHHCLCTGDVVAYCGDPQKTIKLIQDWGVSVVMGNCEEQFANGYDDCGCGFKEGSTCYTLSKQWFAFANGQLNRDDRRWMGERPREIRFGWKGLQVAAIHGGTDNISRYIFASTVEEEKIRQAARVNADVILAGHCGLPFTQVLKNGVIWHNAGALGMPANDGTPDVWYSLLSPHDGQFAISHHRLTYDYQGAAKRMRAEGLAEDYAHALVTGYWPSLDVLSLG